MKKFLLGLVTALMLATFASADVTIVGETKVEANRLVRLKVDYVSQNDDVVWDVYPFDAKIDIATTPGNMIEFVAPAGTYVVQVTVRTIDWEAKKLFTERGRVTVVVGTPAPTPTPPGPTPPEPAPTPPPIPVAGFRVLILYETSEVKNLPPAQSSILFSKSLRDYLDAHCVTGPDGVTKEWRIWDKDIDVSNESDVWKKAMARPHTGVPWIIISDGKTGFEGPLPETLDKAKELLQKYGGR